MKESRFRFSHVVLFLFLLCFGCGVGYLMIYSIFISYFDFSSVVAFLFYIPTFILAVILPIYSAFSLVVSDIQDIRSGKSTSFYAKEKDN